ncbi:uncharacterized protein LOC132294615 [Cornus florida]|uniref:uncharacterized protein LOC132294615 n=1 Tax=Cornus florida TaxID=4283 RepID=UPI00289DDBD4|nr:uncharacterized protein LOC132294615 [Cornus florida]
MKSKSASNPKSKGKKAKETDPEEEVKAYVLAEAGAPWTPSFSRADKSVLHTGYSMITDPSAALAVARGMWLPKDEEIIGRMGLEQLLPSAPVRTIEGLYHTMALCATVEAQSFSLQKLENDLNNSEKKAFHAIANAQIAYEDKDVYKKRLAASDAKVELLEAEVQRLNDALSTYIIAGRQMQGRYSSLVCLSIAKAYRSGFNQGSDKKTTDPEAFDAHMVVSFPYDESPKAQEVEVLFVEMVKAHPEVPPAPNAPTPAVAPGPSIPPTSSPAMVDAFESALFDPKRK